MQYSGRSRGWGGRAWNTVRGRGPGWSVAVGALAVAVVIVGGATRGQESIGEPSPLRLVRRATVQDQGAWVLEYEVQNASAAGVVITPDELEARVAGWVSNSRSAGHALPRESKVALHGCAGASAQGQVIESKDDAKRCHERLILSIWSDDAPRPEAAADAPLAPISLAPGASGRLRLRIEHQHAIQGGYDPLLGSRTIAVRVGQETFHEVVPLDREQYLAQPRSSWSEPPADRRDPERFVSAPDSLHLEAHAPGRQYYRFPDLPVRHGARMRLSYWYLIAVGTAGECRVRFSQYKDTPPSCRVLSDGGFDQEMTEVGRWVKVDKIVHIEPEATTAALDFRVTSEVNVGEMWIDDVVLSPIAPDALAAGP